MALAFATIDCGAIHLHFVHGIWIIKCWTLQTLPSLRGVGWHMLVLEGEYYIFNQDSIALAVLLPLKRAKTWIK